MEIIEQVQKSPRTSWQQWAVWLAKSGYSDIEHSTLMTAQRLARQRETGVAEPLSIAAAESVSFSLMMAAAAD